MVSKLTSALEEVTVSTFQGLCYINILEKMIHNKSTVTVSAHKMYRNMKDPWKIIFQLCSKNGKDISKGGFSIN